MIRFWKKGKKWGKKTIKYYNVLLCIHPDPLKHLLSLAQTP